MVDAVLSVFFAVSIHSVHSSLYIEELGSGAIRESGGSPKGAAPLFYIEKHEISCRPQEITGVFASRA